MADISKAIRHKRFKIKEGANVQLVIETRTGHKLTLQVTDCSLTGIGAISREIISSDLGLEINEIVPSSKIVFNAKEFALGRLILRTHRNITDSENISVFGYSTVDFRVPVDSTLSQVLDAQDGISANPLDFELSPEKFNVASFSDTEQGNIDILQKTSNFEIFYDEWIKTTKYQHNTIRQKSSGEHVKIRQTRKDGRNDYLVMGSNDYLGLASHPDVCEAAKNAIDEYGFGSTGSPLTTGTTDLHKELESLIAKLFEKEEVLLFNSGYTANIGTLAGITFPNDIIIADFLAHASIQDGMKMSRADHRLFIHNDTKHLEKLLKEHRNKYAGALIATEGVFSMDGDTPPIEKIVDLAEKYNARVYLDEAHSFGVTGKNGLGCWERVGSNKIDIIMGTFSKIGGGIGGFIAAEKRTINWLTWHARSHVFSVSVPPSTAAATLAALKIFINTPKLHQQLINNIKHFITGLRNMGCNLPENHQSAVIPVIVGDEKKLGKMNEIFRKEGVYVIPVIYPAVSKKNCRFRFTMMATHTTSDLDFALSILEKAMNYADFHFEKPSEQK